MVVITRFNGNEVASLIGNVVHKNTAIEVDALAFLIEPDFVILQEAVALTFRY